MRYFIVILLLLSACKKGPVKTKYTFERTVSMSTGLKKLPYPMKTMFGNRTIVDSSLKLSFDTLLASGAVVTMSLEKLSGNTYNRHIIISAIQWREDGSKFDTGVDCPDTAYAKLSYSLTVPLPK